MPALHTNKIFRRHQCHSVSDLGTGHAAAYYYDQIDIIELKLTNLVSLVRE